MNTQPFSQTGRMTELCCSHLKTSDIVPVSKNDFLLIQATIESRFTLKRVRDMIRTHREIVSS